MTQALGWLATGDVCDVLRSGAENLRRMQALLRVYGSSTECRSKPRR